MEANKTTLITKIKEPYENPLLIKDSSFIENILHNIIPYIDDEGLTNILKNDPKPINGISFLEFLAQTDHTSEMKEILSRIKSHPDDIRNIADAMLLSSAALNGNNNMMKLLIDLGANIDSKEKGNYTPFILRILSGPISTECLNFYMGKIENLSTMIGAIQELSERHKQKCYQNIYLGN